MQASLAWLEHYSGALQTLINLATFIIAVLSLRILKVYARDTRTIADATLKQQQSQETPLVILQVNEGKTSGDDTFYDVVNVGNSPALNVQVRISSEGQQDYTQDIGALAANASAELFETFSWQGGWNAEITFYSLSNVPMKTVTSEVGGVYPIFSLVRS